MTTLIKGSCYPSVEAIYHNLGGKEAGLTPMNIKHEGISHWYLRWNVNNEVLYIDTTVSQFKTIPPYEKGRGCGFLTKNISKRGKLYV